MRRKNGEGGYAALEAEEPTSYQRLACCAEASLAFGNRTVFCEEAQERAEEAPLLGESPSDFPVILLKVVSEA